ncbi:thaumatin-like protein, partial [Rhizoctonia solani]
MKSTALAFWLASSLPVAMSRTFTVYNACPFTIWPAVFTDLNVGSATPSVETGWEAAAYTSRTFSVPNDWKAGRIWGRRNCDFSVNPGPNSCLSGGCNGGLLCDSRTGTGVPPVSLAEWTLSGDGNRDFYDVSLVDGYNLPMRITNNVGCPVADCPVDLGPNCPEPIKGPFDSSGFPVGCKMETQVILLTAAPDHTILQKPARLQGFSIMTTSKVIARTRMPTHTMSRAGPHSGLVTLG